MVKKGDTLVEVTLAIGIFSMIAVSVTAIMNGSTSGSQANLETTLTREEVDLQAEALRFIQSSYSASQDNADTRYKDLWQAISKNKAVELTDDEAENKKIVEYQPASCAEVYNQDIFKNEKAFAINPSALSAYTNTGKDSKPKPDDVLISDSNLKTTITYPRLFNSAAYGIFIIAVPDKDTTTLVAGASKQPAFYDFYIRTCWYGTDADYPSTISTTVRLYNPDAVVAVAPAESFWVDLNTSINDKSSQTSGVEGFEAEFYINDQYEGKYEDYYKPITLGSKVRIDLLKKDGYYLDNKDTICNVIESCEIEDGGEKYIITFTVQKVNSATNSTNRQAINIEPIWKTK